MVHGALIAEILRLDEERVAGGERGRRRVEEVEATVVLGGNAPSATHTRGHRGICALARVSTLGSGFWLLLGLAVEVRLFSRARRELTQLTGLGKKNVASKQQKRHN